MNFLRALSWPIFFCSVAFLIAITFVEAQPVRGPTRETIAGDGGDVSGPASSVDESCARMDGTTGKLIQDTGSNCTITNAGNMVLGGTISVPGAGTDSQRFGDTATAAGANSVAMGRTASAPSTGGVAIGNNAIANGNTSVAIGEGSVTVAGATSAFSMGTSASSALQSVAIGASSDASGTDAVAVGFGSTATQTRAVSLGKFTFATAGGATCIGAQSQCSASDAVALGATHTADGTNSILIGGLNDAGGFAETILIGTSLTATAANQGQWGNATTRVNLNLSSGFIEEQQTIGADDTTPAINLGSHFTTSANTGATAITDLDLGLAGQMITVCGGSDTNSSKIADSANFSLDRDIVLGLDVCVVLLVQADNDYIEITRSTKLASTLVSSHANDAMFPSASPCGASSRNAHAILSFDDGVDVASENCVFEGVMPDDYAGGTITVTVVYALQTATTGTVEWNGQWERIDDAGLDIDADSFAAIQTTGAITVPGTSGVTDYATMTFTQAQADGLAAGEAFRFKLIRDTPGDSAADDAQMLRWFGTQ